MRYSLLAAAALSAFSHSATVSGMLISPLHLAAQEAEKQSLPAPPALFSFGPDHEHSSIPAGPISCPLDSQLSCHNTTSVPDLCCFSHPGGQLLLAQFWDSNPATGPDDVWTLHGLWPDHCDGGFDVFCDNKRSYSNITAILNHFNRGDMVSKMGEIWKSFNGHDDSFWEHEWNKHGTCTNTLDPSCYDVGTYEPTLEVVHYFDAALQLWDTLPSYKFLADAGITPSTVNTYSRDQIQAALSAAHGGEPVTLGCRGSRLNEIWYHFSVRGHVLGGQYVPAPPDGNKSTCPSEGIRWLPKHRGPGGAKPDPRPKKPSPPTTPPPGLGLPWSGRGHVQVKVVTNEKKSGSSEKAVSRPPKKDGPAGCLIASGSWFTSGTCATFTAKPEFESTAEVDPVVRSFTLESRRGPCAFVPVKPESRKLKVHKDKSHKKNKDKKHKNKNKSHHNDENEHDQEHDLLSQEEEQHRLELRSATSNSDTSRELICARSVRNPTVFVPITEGSDKDDSVLGLVSEGGDARVRFFVPGGRPGHAQGRRVRAYDDDESEEDGEGEWISMSWIGAA